MKVFIAIALILGIAILAAYTMRHDDKAWCSYGKVVMHCQKNLPGITISKGK